MDVRFLYIKSMHSSHQSGSDRK